MKSLFWNLLYSRWPAAPVPRQPGYTILLPVPGDLPVFLKVAMEVCAAQEPDHRVETLVLPDMMTPTLAATFARYKQSWPDNRIRLVPFTRTDRFVAKQLRSPHTKHWLQFITGVGASCSTHALLHDADLFISRKDFLRTHYQECAQRQLACLGVSDVWDGWYQERGINHIVATWELMFSTDWARGFKRWEHRGQLATFEGQTHEFDTTLLPQCHTPAAHITRHEQEWGFVHFNYVICTYRWFQESRGPYEDDRFRLLLVRLLIDAYDPQDTSYEVPVLADLMRGLTDHTRRVTYRASTTHENYGEFRTKLQQLLDSGILDDQKREVLENGVQPFDHALAWAKPVAAPRLPPPLPSHRVVGPGATTV